MTDGLGLEDVYGGTIERIKAQGGYKSRLGMGALMWICYADGKTLLESSQRATKEYLGEG